MPKSVTRYKFTLESVNGGGEAELRRQRDEMRRFDGACLLVLDQLGVRVCLMTTARSLAYLGPEGSFTHQAALVLAPAQTQLVAEDALDRVLDRLRAREVEYAVAARTSAAGPIVLTQHAIESGELVVLDEHAIAVSFDLYRRKTDQTPLIGVVGHEKALAQLSHWITSESLLTQAFPSNTAGLTEIARSDEPGWGALGPAGLAETYQLRLAAKAVQGEVQLETRFVLLRRKTDDRS